jgi:hypothetical protein
MNKPAIKSKTHLSTQITLTVHVNVFTILGPHAASELGFVACRIFLELQFSHAVEQLRQVASNLDKKY